jgi:hypothetical protein
MLFWRGKRPAPIGRNLNSLIIDECRGPSADRR